MRFEVGRHHQSKSQPAEFGTLKRGGESPQTRRLAFKGGKFSLLRLPFTTEAEALWLQGFAVEFSPVTKKNSAFKKYRLEWTLPTFGRKSLPQQTSRIMLAYQMEKPT